MSRPPAPLSASGPAVLPSQFVQPGLSLTQILAILWDYRMAIGVTVLVTVLVTGVVSKLLPKTYDATATLLIDFDVNDPLTGKEFPSVLAPSYMATQLEFIGSPATLLPVVDQLNLTADPHYTAGYSGAGSGGLREYAMARLASTLTISQGTTSRFIYVNCAAHDAQLATTIANTVAETYIREQLKRVADPARERVQSYDEQLSSLRKAVDEAQEKVTAFREKTGLIDMQDKVNIDTERLTDLQARLSEAQAQRRDAQQRNARGSEADAHVLDSGLIQQLKNDLATKEADLAQMASVLGPRHPDYIALQSEVAASRERLQREVGNYRGNARADLGSAQTIENELASDLKTQRDKVLETRRLQDEGSRYQRELETATTVYRKALDGYDQVLLNSRSKYSSATIASPAAVPLKASKPKTSVNVIIGFFVGLFFGVAGSLLFELRNRRVRCREDIEDDLGLPVLAEFGGARKSLLRLPPKASA